MILFFVHFLITKISFNSHDSKNFQWSVLALTICQIDAIGCIEADMLIITAGKPSFCGETLQKSGAYKKIAKDDFLIDTHIGNQ